MDGARIIIMKDIELSLRMKTVADMVKPGGRVCDIGCDHAFVSIYLVANGISDRVIASDVRTGPCAIANALMAIPNLICMILMSGEIAKDVKELQKIKS